MASTAAVSEILSEWDLQLAQLTYALQTNPASVLTLWEPAASSNGSAVILPHDNRCPCAAKQTDGQRKAFCLQCSHLRRLTATANNMPMTARDFIIRQGPQVGQRRQIVTVDNVKPLLRWNNAAAARAKAYIADHPEVLSCGTPTMSEPRCLQSDKFTHQILTMICLQALFVDQNLPHINGLTTAHLCGNSGTLVYELDDTIATDNWRARATVQTVQQLWSQLLVMLLNLSCYSFSHGSPSLNALTFVNKPCNYMHGHVFAAAPFTVRLKPPTTATLTIGDVHLFTDDHNTRINNSDMIPVIEMISEDKLPRSSARGDLSPNRISKETGCTSNGTYYFRLTADSLTTLKYLRHAGITLYSGALDTYALLTATMLEPRLYQAVKADAGTDAFWAKLWLPAEQPTIEARLLAHHATCGAELASSETVLNIFRGAWLRCDILPVMFAALPHSE